jgi:hypothetical protein
MVPEFYFTPELHLRDGRIIRYLGDAAGFRRKIVLFRIASHVDKPRSAVSVVDLEVTAMSIARPLLVMRCRLIV